MALTTASRSTVKIKTESSFLAEMQRLLVQCRRSIEARLRAREMQLVYVRTYTVRAHFRKQAKRKPGTAKRRVH